MPTPAPPTDPAALDLLVTRMLGNRSTFFRRHWRTRPYFAPAVGGDWADSYDVEDFLADMVATQPSPYLAVSARGGKRLFSRHDTPEGLRDAVGDGAVSAMKASRSWHGAMPQSWAWMRALFGSL